MELFSRQIRGICAGYGGGDICQKRGRAGLRQCRAFYRATGTLADMREGADLVILGIVGIAGASGFLNIA